MEHALPPDDVVGRRQCGRVQVEELRGHEVGIVRVEPDPREARSRRQVRGQLVREHRVGDGHVALAGDREGVRHVDTGVLVRRGVRETGQEEEGGGQRRGADEHDLGSVEPDAGTWPRPPHHRGGDGGADQSEGQRQPPVVPADLGEPHGRGADERQARDGEEAAHLADRDVVPGVLGTGGRVALRRCGARPDRCLLRHQPPETVQVPLSATTPPMSAARSEFTSSRAERRRTAWVRVRWSSSRRVETS